jgi:hypothetical protein
MNRLRFLPLAMALASACVDDPSIDDTGALAPEDVATDELARRIGPKISVKPVVTGTRTVGSTLTVSAGTWTGVAPITITYKWRRCDENGTGCTDIAGATRATYTLTGNDPRTTLRAVVHASDANGHGRNIAVDAGPVSFAAGTVCNASGTTFTRPDTLEHVIVILMENRDSWEVSGNGAAPYFSAIEDQCGSSTAYVDNLFPTDINSLSHYLALTSGSNCNTGIGSSGSGCVTDDSSPSSHRLTTTSIFDQVDSWKAYQEDMPSACSWGNPASGTNYFVKHNPAAYYSDITDCGTWDVGMARVSCPSTTNGVCSTPNNTFTADLANDTLPAYSFVTPDILNDMHDGSVTTGDNWLHTYLPLILASPAYKRGDTAVYVLWDEQGSFDSGGIPNLMISPYIRPTSSATTMNHFAALAAMEAQLGIATELGCAGGTPPGNSGTCPSGSSADLRAIFNF